MKTLDDLTATEVRKRLDYNPETGILTWKWSDDVEKRLNSRIAGKTAGCLDKARGYILVGLNNRSYLAHRLCWLIHHGRWPNGILDHKDLNGSNNRILNLREGSQHGNMANQDAPVTNRSGYKGVYLRKELGRWAANIMVNKRTIYLGLFDAKEDAASAYNDAAAKYFGEFARLNGTLR